MFKRTFDLIAAAVGLVTTSPALLAVAALIKLEDGGAVFYRGVRVGRFGKTFRMWKFRTMVMGADKIGSSSSTADDPRISKIGRTLRKYKLDELPQLINVLIGDMSLVGPRPQVAWAVRLYSEKEKVVLTVRPGITDYASLLFSHEGEILRGSSDPDKEYLEKIHPEKMRLSLDYVNNQSFRTDCCIMFETLQMVLLGKKPSVPNKQMETGLLPGCATEPEEKAV
ncbi:MAG: sugar transferase [Acidobacteria bacterium]|nr:sugar transferase [Acidobacteriota bacterium]